LNETSELRVAGDAPVRKVPHHGLITVSLMMATIMQTLDNTIANVALPHIQGSVSATQEQMSWVLTSYIIAAAVTIPFTGWLSGRIGRKRVLLGSILGFTVTSVLCGMAQTLPQIVIFRLLQGISGAALIPMSQAALLAINPPERHGRAMSIWVMGVTIGPILGPALGAWLTEQFSWRWVFYVNVPIGLLCYLGLSRFLTESTTKRSRFDFLGFATLSIAILALQTMLDRGQLKDWFASTEICIEGACAAIAAYLFAVHSAMTREPFIDLRIFKDRNFFVGNIFLLMIGVLLFGPLALLPALLQDLLNYPVLTAGLLTASRGLGTLASTLVLKRMLQFLDPRVVIGIGFVATGIGMWQMCQSSLQMPQSPVFWAGMLQGFGLGLAYVPLVTASFGTLSARFLNEATSVSSLIRNLGSSVGIAAVQALFVRNTQIMHARLSEHVTPYAAHVHEMRNLTSTAGLIAMNGDVTQQATMMAYNNVFKLMFILSMLCVPLVLLLRRAGAGRPVAVVAE
jgi:DHA2 family multidrug resistance protein